jgi:hypothetical protein
MRLALIVLIVVHALASFVIFVGARSAIHEILAGVTFLVAAVLLGALAIVNAIDKARSETLVELQSIRVIASEQMRQLRG